MIAPRVLLSIFLIALPTFASETSHAAPDDVPPRAHLVFEGYRDSMLERRYGDRWVIACADNCDRDLSIDGDVVGAQWRVHDLQGRTSAPFRIRASAGQRVTLIAHRPSRTQHDVGVWTTTLGVLALIGSTVALGYVFLEAAVRCRPDPDYPTGHTNPTSSECPSFTPVLLALGASALATTVGVALLASSDPSASQSQSLERTVASVFVRKPSPEGSDVPRLALPSSAAEDAVSLRMPRAWTAPLLTVHF